MLKIIILISGVNKKTESSVNVHSDSEVDDYNMTNWKQSEFKTQRKPLPLRSAHLSSEPTAPARVARRRDMPHKNATEENKFKNEDNKFSESNARLVAIDNVTIPSDSRSNSGYRYTIFCWFHFCKKSEV